MAFLPDLILRAVRDFDLWEGGARLVCGVSGGADSTALLCGVLELPARHRPDVIAAHFDHGLRPEAAADAESVARLCADLGVPCRRGRAPSRAPKRGSPEAAMRRERYAFLGEVAAAAGAGAVAVAHQREDRAETVLLRLGRGSGSGGLSGIRPVAPLPCGPGGARLVRPLWFASRSDVLEYLELRGRAWREDGTNGDLAVPRNRLRHEVLPALERALGPGVRTAVLRSADNLAEDEAALEVWASAELRRRARPGGVLRTGAGWEELPAAIRHRTVQAWWREGTGLPPLGRRHVRQALAGGGVDLPDGWRIEGQAGGGSLLLRPPAGGPGRVPGAARAGVAAASDSLS